MELRRIEFYQIRANINLAKGRKTAGIIPERSRLPKFEKKILQFLFICHHFYIFESLFDIIFS